MTAHDAISMDRIAQRLVVEAKTSASSPPTLRGAWIPIWSALVDRVEINIGSRFSTARIEMPDLRWNLSSRSLARGNLIRIRTDEPLADNRSIIFEGFITGYSRSFSGGMGSAGGFSSAHEANIIVCHDYRWLMSVTSVLFGMLTRGPDDYDDYGVDGPIGSPKDNYYTYLTGRRAIFNQDGKPDKDIIPLNLTTYWPNIQVPIFGTYYTEPWTARDMIRYCLSPIVNLAKDYLPWSDPNLLTGLSDPDWATILNHIVIDGLNVIEAVDLICRHIGWSFREEYHADGPHLVFFKPGDASGYSRSIARPTIFHRLHAPAVGEIISAAVASGSKMLWSMALDEDISSLVNTPIGFSSPHRFEFTAELVPAWLDADLVPDTSESNANLYFTDSDLQGVTDANAKTYYRCYHKRGSEFRRNVGRQWALNETGKYTFIDTFDRGMPFDFKTVIPPERLSALGKDFAPFNRQVLPCLTLDKQSLNSIGIVVEFSFDGGSTWHVFPCTISSLPDECGILIDEPNLCEIVDESGATISGGILDGVQLNYWTSLADDKLNSRSFKLDQWHTRLRVTASVQMDRRISRYATASSPLSSPFDHCRLYDFSDKYGLSQRTALSAFDGSSYPADEINSTSRIDAHLNAIRDAYQDASLSGIFILDRLWLGDGAGEPAFHVGDGIEGVTGRWYNLTVKSGSKTVYPEIVQIAYLHRQQRMQLVTRDLRFAEVRV
jgi:hypothetical protein